MRRGWLDPPDLGSEELYDLRRDAMGVPATAAATLRNPGPSDVLGYAHLLLRRAGASQTPVGYDLAGRRIRVVNGSGMLLQTVQDRFRETPFEVADIVVCAGATDVGLPLNVVRERATGRHNPAERLRGMARPSRRPQGARRVMDIATQSEVLLRSAGYETWTWPGGSVPVVCFENAAVVGFLHVFASGESLLADWQQIQQATLGRQRPRCALQAQRPGTFTPCSWLAAPNRPSRGGSSGIEEDFSMTRKIARGDLRTVADLRRTLLPLPAGPQRTRDRRGRLPGQSAGALERPAGRRCGRVPGRAERFRGGAHPGGCAMRLDYLELCGFRAS